MSPEIRRVSRGWAIHERKRKAMERKAAPSMSPVTQPENPENIFWQNITRAISKNFAQDPDMLNMLEEHKRFFRRFANGRRAVTLGLDITDYEKLQDEYLNDSNSPKYNPDFWDKASPILKIITAESARLAPSSRNRLSARR